MIKEYLAELGLNAAKNYINSKTHDEIDERKLHVALTDYMERERNKMRWLY